MDCELVLIWVEFLESHENREHRISIASSVAFSSYFWIVDFVDFAVFVAFIASHLIDEPDL